jgi:hypothetical protein
VELLFGNKAKVKRKISLYLNLEYLKNKERILTLNGILLEISFVLVQAQEISMLAHMINKIIFG